MSGIERILIVGASTRAAAFSARRGGLRPICLDQFADADLALVGDASRFEADEDVETLASSALQDCDAWLYTGSIEARPSLVDRLTRVAPLLGNGPQVLRRVRDPWAVSQALVDAGLPALSLRKPTEAGGPLVGWLRKSRSTAGGTGVSWAGESSFDPHDDADLQRYIEGPTFSALFLAAGGRSRLVGLARQFHGIAGAPFLYKGGIAPITLGPRTEGLVRRIGEVLAAEFRLVGLFGADFVLNDDRPWLLEVNPRYTASVELFELAARQSLLRDHLCACVAGEIDHETTPIGPGPFVGKRVVYARCRLEFPAVEIPRWSDLQPFVVPAIADVPHPGTVIEAGEPILTVLASADSPDECLARLDGAERDWMRRLA
ncbi:ATP-grasp domain-containing protein [Paludisphaera soli]|uniref:ATP-grasp domain-containing protein n=1 Tax=Paludisphaera soli TaxID=2712865 RepID=UPI0013ED6514|nr:ATP-grasp domain-containing protein [Paludisphaera soli]